MPRLRYLKNYEWHDPEDQREDNDDNDSTRTEQYSQGTYTEVESGFEEDSGKSWLSNAQVISSFSESKLYEAISSYKALIRLLEAELLARTFTRNTHPNEYKSDYSKTHRQSETINKKTSGRSKNYKGNGKGNAVIHQVYEMRRMLRQLSLSKDQKRQLFEEWCKIQKEGINHGESE